MINDIDRGISLCSMRFSFADDACAYSCIHDIEKCNKLQLNLNAVYKLAHVKNIFKVRTFNYVSFNGSMTQCGSNTYNLLTNMEIISASRNVW